MSILENILAAVEANTAATNRNSELLEQAAAGREAVLGAVEKATTKPAAADKKAADKKPAAETPPAGAAEGAVDAVAAAVNGYMEGTEGAERDARKAKVAELFGKVGAKKRSEIPADKEAAVLKALATLTEQGNLIADEPAADDDLLN